MQVPMSRMDMAAWPGRTHAYLQVPVLYPFGHGLSYTSFNTTAVRSMVGQDGSLTGFEVDVINTGERMMSMAKCCMSNRSAICRA